MTAPLSYIEKLLSRADLSITDRQFLYGLCSFSLHTLSMSDLAIESFRLDYPAAWNTLQEIQNAETD